MAELKSVYHIKLNYQLVYSARSTTKHEDEFVIEAPDAIRAIIDALIQLERARPSGTTIINLQLQVDEP